MQLKPPPWLKHEDNWSPTQWTDRDDALTADWLQHQDIGMTVNVAAIAAETVAKDHSFIRSMFISLIWWGWRGAHRKFCLRGISAPRTRLIHPAGDRCLFIAAVARIMRPGCKADDLPILEGAQDKGKSTAIELLFTPWFSDDLAELGTKDAATQVLVAWGIEIAELASMTRGEIERVKAFITRKVDRFRRKLRPPGYRSSAPKHFHRQHQQRHLPERLNRWPPFLANPLPRRYRSERH